MRQLLCAVAFSILASSWALATDKDVEFWSDASLERECDEVGRIGGDISRSICLSVGRQNLSDARAALNNANTKSPPVYRLVDFCRKTEKIVSEAARCLSQHAYLAKGMSVNYDGSLSAPRPLTDVEKALISEHVGSSLKDPASASYTYLNYNGSNYYCGKVNAKNSYGGYVGKEFFLVRLSNQAGKLVPMDAPALGAGVLQMCAAAGY